MKDVISSSLYVCVDATPCEGLLCTQLILKLFRASFIIFIILYIYIFLCFYRRLDQCPKLPYGFPSQKGINRQGILVSLFYNNFFFTYQRDWIGKRDGIEYIRLVPRNIYSCNRVKELLSSWLNGFCVSKTIKGFSAFRLEHAQSHLFALHVWESRWAK